MVAGLGIVWALVAFWTEAAEWRPAPAPLLTPWAAEVTPENVWPEYPRPTLVREKWVNLNGLWDFAIRPREEARPDQWEGKILVPFCVESALSGVGRSVTPDQRLWYRRTFVCPELPPGGRLLVHFEAVDWQATVWINGQTVGQHSGGYDRFSFDVTDFVRPGENELVVAVWDPTDTGWQPRGKQVLKPHGIWYTAVTGIWQTVWLEPVPAEFIRGVRITPDVDHQAVQLRADAPGGTRVLAEAFLEGKKVAEAWGSSNQPFTLSIPEPRLWWPHEPTLYDLKLSLFKGDQLVDTVRSYFGLRKIEIAKDQRGINRMMLNGRPVFHFGPLDQGWWPDGLYTAPTDEALRYDIIMTKKYGMNTARKHVKYEPERWYYWCDKLGLMVWQDMPSGDFDKSPEGRANYRRELRAMIDRLWNHPSVVMWVPFNEGWGQHDTCEIADWIKQYDPSRLVNEASGWHNNGCGDVSDMHKYPGPGMRPLEERRACVLGEFGGLGLPISGHLWREEGAWGYRAFKDQQSLTDAYVDLLRRVRLLIGQGLCGAIYTQTTDVEIEVNGLMTYDRIVAKIDIDRAYAAAQKLYLPPPEVTVLVPTSETVPQQWRYTLAEPPAGWFAPEFDDSTWQEGVGGFGRHKTPGAVVRTEWTTSDIWLRRSFDLTEVPAQGELVLLIHHDEDAEVYLNGKRLAQLSGYLTSYTAVPLSADGLGRLLRKGKNVLAVHCHQTTGGQYIDVGLAVVQERDQ
jgi:hypothetical protein